MPLIAIDITPMANWIYEHHYKNEACKNDIRRDYAGLWSDWSRVALPITNECTAGYVCGMGGGGVGLGVHVIKTARKS